MTHIEYSAVQAENDVLRMQNKKLREDRMAFIAFCHNIIGGMYIDNKQAASEQLEMLGVKYKPAEK